jgi:hypothetical protein
MTNATVDAISLTFTALCSSLLPLEWFTYCAVPHRLTHAYTSSAFIFSLCHYIVPFMVVCCASTVLSVAAIHSASYFFNMVEGLKAVSSDYK